MEARAEEIADSGVCDERTTKDSGRTGFALLWRFQDSWSSSGASNVKVPASLRLDLKPATWQQMQTLKSWSPKPKRNKRTKKRKDCVPVVTFFGSLSFVLPSLTSFVHPLQCEESLCSHVNDMKQADERKKKCVFIVYK